MKLLYEAANSLEANMLLHLVEQAGYRARIDGEYLQGGVGELQVAGFVRLMVEEADYDAAKEIVAEWDQRQPPAVEVEPEASSNKNSLLFAALFGFLGGLVVAAIYYNTHW